MFGAPVIFNKIYNDYQSLLKQVKDVEKSISIFSNLLGNRIKTICVGGGTLENQVSDFLKKCFSVNLINSYGLSETGNLSHNGKIIPGLDYFLIENLELGHDPSARPIARGEICVKSKEFEGYWNDPQKTKDTLLNGYFRTGDIVEINYDDNSIKIIGRNKDIIKLSNNEVFLI